MNPPSNAVEQQQPRDCYSYFRYTRYFLAYHPAGVARVAKVAVARVHLRHSLCGKRTRKTTSGRLAESAIATATFATPATPSPR